MGLFKHKDKRPDLEPASGPAKNLPPNPNPPAVQNGFNDSTYYSGSDVSHSDPQKTVQNQQKAQGKPPGTTVTTTTTTTTTTTVVTEDGGMQTESHPYNPSTDPPPQQSQTTYPTDPSPALVPNTHNNLSYDPSTTNPATIEATDASVQQPSSQKPIYHRTQTPPRKPTPQEIATMGQHELPTAGPLHPQVAGAPIRENPVPPIPRSSSTSGGRAIPPRSELRNSRPPEAIPAPTSDPRYAEYPPVEPLRTSQPNSNNLQAGVDPTLENPTSPIMPAPRAKTPNFSRPDAATHVSKKDSMMNAVKGIHGAGEALRGTVNGTIARGVRDKAELERSREVREQGLSDFRSSGLREGFREKAEGRMRTRRRSGSANPGEGHGHILDRVDEVR